MKAQHTPDWELETHYNHNNETHLELYGRIGLFHKPIARLYPDCKFADDSDKANASLIAAAPDLLAACELGGIGTDTIILLHNAAGVLEEMGTEGAKQLAAGLRAKAAMEYAAITKARGGN